MDASTPYRFGGWAAVIVALAYLFITFLRVLVGPPPDGREELIPYLAPIVGTWWMIVLLSVVTDLLLLSVVYALYVALRSVDRNLVLAGCGLLAVFALLDLAVTWTNHAGLLTLAEDYPGATLTTQESLIQAAQPLAAVLESILSAVYVILVPGLGIVLLSVAMYRSDWGGVIAFVGIATGLLAAIAVFGEMLAPLPDVLVLVISALTAAWVGLAGYKLLRLAAPTASETG